jgi:hypothetical protein
LAAPLYGVLCQDYFQVQEPTYHTIGRAWNIFIDFLGN